MTIRHVYTSPVPDSPATTIVRPSDWNSAHLIALAMAGNVAGATLASGTDIALCGGPNVTLSGDAQSVVFSVQPPGAATDHSHGNPILALTNLSGTTGSNSAGFTLSLSAAVGGGAGDGWNVIAAGGSTAASTGTIVFSNSNNVSFGLNGATVTASHDAQTVQTQNVHNLTLSGNTAGVMAQVSSGTLTLAGGNNITLSQNGNAITISGGAAGAADGINALVVNGGASTASTTLALSNSNNVSFGHNAGTITASASFPAQTVQPGIQSIAFGNTTYTTGAVSFSNANGISFGSSGGQVTASYTVPSQSVQTQNMVSVQGSTGAISFANANGVSFGGNASTITGSVAAGATATGNLGALAAGGVTQTSGTVIFSNSNGVSFGLNAGTVTASHNALTTAMASNEPHIRQIVGGTATYTSGSVVFTGLGGITIDATNNSIGISFDGHHLDGLIPSGNGYGTGFSSMTSGTVGLVAVGALSMSQNGNGLSLSVPAQTAQTQNLHNVTLSGNTAGAMAQVSSGTLTLVGGNNITLSQAGNAITISGGAAGGADGINALVVNGGASTASTTLALSNSNNVTFGLNAGTITASASYSQSTAPSGIAGSNTTYTSGVVEIIGSNAATVRSSAGQRIAIDVAAQTVQTQGSVQINGSTGAISFATGSSLSSSSNGSTITFGLASNITTALQSAGAYLTTAALSNHSHAFSASGGSSTFQTLSFANSNGLTFSNSGGSVIASYTVPGATVFSNSNNVSFGLNGSTVTATATFAQTAQTVGLYASSQTTGQSSSSTYDARSITLRGAGIVTVGNSGGEFIISATGGAGGGATLSTYEPYPAVGLSTASVGGQSNSSNAVSFFPFVIDEYVSCGVMNLLMTANFTTVGTSSGRQTAGMMVGLYTRATDANSTKLATLDSASFAWNVTGNNSSYSINQVTATSYSGYAATAQTNSAGVNISSGYTGAKIVGIPVGLLLPPGPYWLGIIMTNSTSSVNVGLTMGLIGVVVNTGITAVAPIGSFSTAYSSGANVNDPFGNLHVGLGSWTSAGSVTGLPASVGLNSISRGITLMPIVKLWRT